MKKLKRKKGYVAVLFALLFAAAGLQVASAYAANVIDPTEPCTLTLSVPAGEEYTAELNEMELHAKLYQVATVNAAGTYTETADFTGLSIKDAVSGDTTWEELTAKAAELAWDKKETTDCRIINGTGTKELAAGMYLVLPEPVTTTFYEYEFNPSLIALPDNQAMHGVGAENKWTYEVNANLKPERSHRYGSLLIEKNLSDYNETMKEVTFVFNVEAVDGDGNLVYSNVVSTTHSAAGSKAAIADHIPAGAKVTVTEVYSGAGYRLVSEPQQTAEISAEEIVKVEFENTYDHGLNPGYGVTNHFDYDEDEGWQWSQLPDNSVREE